MNVVDVAVVPLVVSLDPTICKMSVAFPPVQLKVRSELRDTVAGSPPVTTSGAPTVTDASKPPTSLPPAPCNLYGPATMVPLTAPGIGRLVPMITEYALFVSVNTVLVRFDPAGPVSVTTPASSDVWVVPDTTDPDPPVTVDTVQAPLVLVFAVEVDADANS